ncbi:TIGR04255 family protein [Microbulbifer sp. CnH-101-G]|uniref:TIGR04255 family protein n=1 Tax=Microbulbifer sp. CnH-101-G TaxID=3243393 RepID=UPI00403A16BC
MQYESLGYMPRAPLVYSLAMIEYGSAPGIANYADAIMEELRGPYPDIKELKLNSLKVNIDAATGESRAQHETLPHWRMNNPDSDFGFVFGANRLVIHTTAYKHFNEFADKIRDIASVISNIARIQYSSNIGVRHIDNICNIDGLELNQLLKGNYLCPQLGEGLNPLNSRVEFVYKSDIGRLFTRAFELSNHPKVPQDLFPMASELSSAPNLMVPVTEKFVLVDTDHIYSPGKLEAFDLNEIISKLDSLHEQCSVGFRNMVSEDALGAWKKGIE